MCGEEGEVINGYEGLDQKLLIKIADKNDIKLLGCDGWKKKIKTLWVIDLFLCSVPYVDLATISTT